MTGNKPLFVFIDEAGDFNFSPNGSRFYTITAVVTRSPWDGSTEIAQLKHMILSGDMLPAISDKYLEEKLCHHFHASEDRQQVRDLFFKIICGLQSFKVYSIVVRKNRTNPSLRDPKRFYSKLMSDLLSYIFKAYTCSVLCVYVDGIPVSKEKNAFIAAVKAEIKAKQPCSPYRIYYPNSASESFLQISDYINWAIFRKWEGNDFRSYDLIKNFLGTPELDVFRQGDRDYY